MKIFGRKGAPISRAGRIIDETERETEQKPKGKVVKLDDQRKKSEGKK